LHVLNRKFIETHKRLEFVGLFMTGITKCNLLSDELSAVQRPDIVVCNTFADVLLFVYNIILIDLRYCEPLITSQ